MAANAKKAAPAPFKWAFKARFRRHAFGWKSQPAIQRIKQAVAEIRKVAKKDPVLAAEGAVEFLERVTSAIEHVDGSSGAIGSAVNGAVAALADIIAAAPAERRQREVWLERLFAAHEADTIPYIESLADHWGALCATPEIASAWADRLLEPTRLARRPREEGGRHFHGTSACLSALLHAGRHAEILTLLENERFWPYARWAVRALAAQGKVAEALHYAERNRDATSYASDVAGLCEEILLSTGDVDAAYRRHGIAANRAGTYLATFRALVKKYPHKQPADVLSDLVRSEPGSEGKWFAAAKEAGLFSEALALAGASPCDPRTLTRAARDHAEKNPAFAVGTGLLALHWLVEGYGYEITGLDVFKAFRSTMHAAERQGTAAETRARIRAMVAAETGGGRFVTRILGPELGL